MAGALGIVCAVPYPLAGCHQAAVPGTPVAARSSFGSWRPALLASDVVHVAMPLHPVPPGERAVPPLPPHVRSAADQRLDDALRGAVARYYAGARTPDQELQSAVCGLVDVLHAQGLDVVTVLLALKARVTACGPPPSRLLDHVVRWCIARYYDVPASSGPATGSH